MASPQEMLVKLLPCSLGGSDFAYLVTTKMALHNPVGQQYLSAHFPLLDILAARITLTSTPWKTTTDPRQTLFGKRMFLLDYRDLRYPLYLFQNMFLFFLEKCNNGDFRFRLRGHSLWQSICKALFASSPYRKPGIPSCIVRWDRGIRRRRRRMRSIATREVRTVRARFPKVPLPRLVGFGCRGFRQKDD